MDTKFILVVSIVYLMDIFETIQKEVGEWSQENFPDQPDVNPYIGSSEEFGELADALDFSGNPTDEEIDAVGDILVYFADFCAIRGLDYQEAYEKSEEIEAKYENMFREWASARGKLDRSVLKKRQGIRLDEDRVSEEAEIKALARILNCLENFCDERGYTIEESIQQAWYDEVIDRDWDSSYQS